MTEGVPTSPTPSTDRPPTRRTDPRSPNGRRPARGLHPGHLLVLPELFGRSGRDAATSAHGRRGTARTAVGAIRDICVSREFTLFAVGRTSPVIPRVRALARAEHERCGGPGVGAVGMCLTGGFALAIGGRRGWTTDISEEDLAIVEQRCAAGLPVLGVRFRG